MNDDAIVRWTLWHDGRSITCTEHTAHGGLEVQVTYDSLPLATQHCDRVEDAARWSDRIRERWEATGWREAGQTEAQIEAQVEAA
jgi:hypothetical protein